METTSRPVAIPHPFKARIAQAGLTLWQIRELLSQGGRTISESRLSYWLSGKKVPMPQHLCDRLDAILREFHV